MNDTISTSYDEGWYSVAEIHTQHLLDNLSYLRRCVEPGILQMAVIKADAYGHGAVATARVIAKAVDWIGVYQVREGAELRESGIDTPILVFGTPTPETARFYLEYQLTATVSCLEHFDILYPGTSYHIKFDTGMGRVGFLPHMVDRVEKEIHAQPHLRYTGLMTHFADSEVVGSAIFAAQQEAFADVAEKLGEHVTVHAANSGATIHQAGVHFDMIRNGTALYGFDPNGKVNPLLKPALTWHSKVSQIRRLPKGSGVSYSHTWHMPDDGNLAVIPVGYADGLNRNLSNKMMVRIGDKYYPQVGNITMDQIMVYLGNDEVESGSDVILLGGTDKTSAYVLADLLGTITYEITCMIGNRVRRIYT
ncbi:MAG: alanine racemase [Bacteroidetes bacterium HLUCCA01]|nr:MAG: alanine racemase [Bacteroidetes bacterium HLUCCA01]